LLDIDLQDWLTGKINDPDITYTDNIFSDESNLTRLQLRGKLDSLDESFMLLPKEEENTSKELIDFRCRVGILRSFFEVAP